MPFIHLTARLFHSQRGRLEGEHAAWLWKHLRPAFPTTFAAVLMPNHPHLVARVDDIARAHASFTKVLGAFARRIHGPRPIWEPVPKPKIVTANKIAVEARYVLLNPVSAGIVKDPLAWLFSTHLDVVGAVADPWVTFDAMRPHLPSWIRTVEEWHSYVSGDRAVRVPGTPLPTAAADTEIASRTLDEILRAAVAATRGRVDGHRYRGPTRDAFLSLAARQGWTDAHRLSSLCDVTTDTIVRIQRASLPHPALDAARLCLGDPRLLSAANQLFEFADVRAPLDRQRRAPRADRKPESPADRPLLPLESGSPPVSTSDRPLLPLESGSPPVSTSDRPLPAPRSAARPPAAVDGERSPVQRAAHRGHHGGRQRDAEPELERADALPEQRR